MLAGAIAGASATSAKLIAADNLYVYAPTTQPMTEDLPMAPITRKGKVRAAMDATLLAAHRVGTVRAAIGRASDFYGPGALNATVGGSRFFKALLAGKPVEWLGRLDVPHSFSYIEDFGRGLVTLGAHEAALGQAWHIPAAEPLTGQQMLDMLFAEAGITAKITRITPALLRLAGIFNPMAHEMQEMIYEFTAPYIIDGTKFTRAFGGTPTSHQVAVRATVAWFKQQHALHA